MLKLFLAEQKQRRFRINEGIAHLEALPVDRFISALRNIDKYVASEKLDGYNLWFGFDQTGFFTSRGGKGGSKCRTVDDYKNTPSSNGFRAVHDALDQTQNILSRYIKPGETIEMEVLFGKQPNAIVYGDNMIAFLRFVETVSDPQGGTERLQTLADALQGKHVKTTTNHTVTDDGLKLRNEMQTHDWKFVTTGFLDKSIVKNVDVSKELDAIEAWVNQPNAVFSDMTNGEVMTVNLVGTPKQDRPPLKAERENVLDTFLHDLKMPIKDKLVQQLLRTTKPSLQTADGEDDGMGIEGIVFLDPDTNEQFKLVDKDLFTAVNKFNFAVRPAIHTTSGGQNAFTKLLGITDSDSSIFDHLVTKVGRVFGISNDLKYYMAKRAIKKYGDTPQQIVDALAANISDFETSKQDLEQAVIAAIKELRKLHAQFKKNWKTYASKLPSGQTVKYSPEIYKRTMTSFAETHEELMAMLPSLRAAQTSAHLASIMFSRQLQRETDDE